MDRNTAKCLLIVGSACMAALAAIFALANNKTAAIIVGIIWVIGYLVLCYFMRCPHCGKWPGKYDFFDGYCPRCGEPLD